MVDADFLDRLREIYVEKDGNDAGIWEIEKPILERAIREIETRLENYEFVKPIARGGAGVVIQLLDKTLGLHRALKLPRPRGDQVLDSVKHEIKHLVNIRHENVIALHTMGEIPIDHLSYPYFVMDYIPDAMDLREYLSQSLRRIESSNDLKTITSWVAAKFLDVARALAFLHDHQIIHFDVKPGNILIDGRGRPILGDLGYAKTFSESDTTVVVGFTLFYAHPDLSSRYDKGSSVNRIRKSITAKDFKYIWDIFALGKTLLEILALIDDTFPDADSYDRTFLYLHLAACRMLDGRNHTDEDVNRLRSREKPDDPKSFRETWMGLRGELGNEEIRYSDISQLVEDLEKLDAVSPYPTEIPELDTFFPNRVQSSEGTPAPFSPRVKNIVEHPVFARLGQVPQLGFARFIYPTATHSRLEHALGTFRNCTQYIQALWNDPFNPFFKQVVKSQDLKCLLLASLLHDLGQYPLAHEFEEVNKSLNHEQLTLDLLTSRAVDNDGHTLRDIIEDKNQGWGANLDCFKEIMAGQKRSDGLFRSSSLKARFLSSIIDGPIDVDKLDYLLRDSDECRLRYGSLIDYERLVRNLTMVIFPAERGQCDIALGIYEKGQSAAESIIFARYLLYQAVYWHHSNRAIRAMLQEALRKALTTQKKGGGSFEKELRSLLGVDAPIRIVTIDQVVGLVEKWTDNQGSNLINLIKERRFYKRILTVHDDKTEEEGKESILELFRSACNRPNFATTLHQKIYDKFITITASSNRSTTSLLASERVDRVKEILADTASILVDIPTPSYGSARPLTVVPEPKRLERNYLTRMDTGERISEVWKQVHHRLMRIASKGRIFCHPDIRDTLMAAIGPEELTRILTSVVRP